MDVAIVLTSGLVEVPWKEDRVVKMIPIIFDLNFVLVNAIRSGQKIISEFLHAIWLEMNCCGQPFHPDNEIIHDHVDGKLIEGTGDVFD